MRGVGATWGGVLESWNGENLRIHWGSCLGRHGGTKARRHEGDARGGLGAAWGLEWGGWRESWNGENGTRTGTEGRWDGGTKCRMRRPGGCVGLKVGMVRIRPGVGEAAFNLTAALGVNWQSGGDHHGRHKWTLARSGLRTDGDGPPLFFAGIRRDLMGRGSWLSHGPISVIRRPSSGFGTSALFF